MVKEFDKKLLKIKNIYINFLNLIIVPKKIKK